MDMSLSKFIIKKSILDILVIIVMIISVPLWLNFAAMVKIFIITFNKRNKYVL
jgi:hypothetical protein